MLVRFPQKPSPPRLHRPSRPVWIASANGSSAHWSVWREVNRHVRRLLRESPRVGNMAVEACREVVRLFTGGEE